MKRRRKNRVLVPMDWSFLKAPYGYTVQMRRADAARHPRRETSRRERVLTNVFASLVYLVLIAGGVLGWFRRGDVLGVFLGLGAAFGVLFVVFLVTVVVYGLLHLRDAIYHHDDDARA